MESRERFFVVNPADEGGPHREFSFACTQVQPHIFSYTSQVCIAATKEYAEGTVLPMSYWSAIAVEMLELHPEARVLDICCAPGMKLVYAGLLLKAMSSEGRYSITGCDISRTRLYTAASLVKKYRVGSVRLLLGDAEAISCTAVSVTASPSEGCRCRLDTPNGKCVYSSTALRQRGHRHDGQFDRVLVDPECSRTSTVKYLNNPVRTERDYAGHQLRVLRHAVTLLAEEGVLVYSTCTFNPAENEEVVAAVLAEFPSLTEIEIETAAVKRYGVSVKNKQANQLPKGDSLFIAKFKLTASTT